MFKLAEARFFMLEVIQKSNIKPIKMPYTKPTEMLYTKRDEKNQSL